MNQVYIIAALIGLTGCSSLQNAGTVSYKIKPLPDGSCCEVSIENGKEYVRHQVFIMKRGDDYTVAIDGQGIEAFQGQAASSSAVQSVVDAAISAAGKIAR